MRSVMLVCFCAFPLDHSDEIEVTPHSPFHAAPTCNAELITPAPKGRVGNCTKGQ